MRRAILTETEYSSILLAEVQEQSEHNRAPAEARTMGYSYGEQVQLAASQQGQGERLQAEQAQDSRM
jgi:hypothetical protein